MRGLIYILVGLLAALATFLTFGDIGIQRLLMLGIMLCAATISGAIAGMISNHPIAGAILGACGLPVLYIITGILLFLIGEL